MRPSSHELTDDMKRLVGEQKLGFVATVCPDGTPNVSPKGSIRVWADGQLVFADLQSPQTVANLRGNPAIEINVVDPLARRGYRFKGEGSVLTVGPLYERIRAELAQSLRRPERIRSIVLVEVSEARPLYSPSYAAGATEQELVEQWLEHHTRLARARAEQPQP